MFQMEQIKVLFILSTLVYKSSLILAADIVYLHPVLKGTGDMENLSVNLRRAANLKGAWICDILPRAKPCSPSIQL